MTDTENYMEQTKRRHMIDEGREATLDDIAKQFAQMPRHDRVTILEKMGAGVDDGFDGDNPSVKQAVADKGDIKDLTRLHRALNRAGR